jgi:superfamily II DNA or RNA helicase
MEVTPNEWMLPNRSGFVNWMYRTFHPDKYPMHKTAQANRITLFPHQRLVRDFMQFDSPYRGILLYHGLGVGKTCASIAAAEGFIAHHKKVVVLVPASLATNYKNEIMRCGTIGTPEDNIWSAVELPRDKEDETVQQIMNTYHLPFEVLKKHSKKLWLPALPQDVKAKNVIKRDVRWKDLTTSEQTQVMESARLLVDVKYTFVSYNGITRKKLDELGPHIFDDAFIVMDEAHNFVSRVANGGKIASKIFNMIMEAKRSKMVFLSGTPVINHPFELSVLLNLVRGPAHLHTYSLLKSGAMPSHDEAEEVLREAGLLSFVDILELDPQSRTITVQLFPSGYIRSDTEGLITRSDWGKTEEVIQQDIHNLLQRKFKVGKKVHLDEVYALPSRKDDFNKLFLDETDPNNPRVKNSDLFMRRILGLISYFRTAGEEYFPSVLPPMLERVEMSDFQFASYVDFRDKERRMENRKKKQNAMAAGLFGKKGTVYRAFSRMACNFVFPENIKRPFPGDMRKELEKELAHHEEDDDDNEEKEDAPKVDKDAHKLYDSKLKDALGALKTNANKPLSHDKLQQLYSPKFARIVEQVGTSPGSCLLYSQFRTVEGLGIMRMVFEEAGYKEIRLEKKDQDWVIADAEEVLSSTYNNKRFVVFQEDREKTDLLVKLFNGKMEDLPPSISEVLKEKKHKNNLYGELAKIIMISQSGAEGISLRNVRRVFITEPFWNKVRIDQVIGRAIRTGSHMDLPERDRNVQVFMYVSVFTPEQLNNNFTLKRLDQGLSSDQHIYDVAMHKDRIIGQFLDMMKRAAFDCMTNASQNKLMENKIQCYAFPINMDSDHLSFLPTLEQEEKALTHTKLKRRKRIQGRVVTKKGKKYVLVDDMSGLFDYRAYKDAGVLLPAIS